MLSFYKIANICGRNKGNYLNSIIINLFYLILIIPGLYISQDPYLSRYWFFILLLIYLIIYSRLYRLTKKLICYIKHALCKGQVAELVYALVLETSAARLKSSSLFLPTKKIMKIEVQSKKGLRTILSVHVDKKTIQKKLKSVLTSFKKKLL